tara:strand:+ start:14837 stop:15523 length:687 start_codon:yes stop_codon:yes gene_type:complete
MEKHYEYLTKLYLRLKGYVVSNLIIHSESQGNSKTEIDIIGIRMPYHLQEDRQVNFHDDLECSNSKIEIIIADVKSTKQLNKVKFNKGLRQDGSSINKLIGWLGCYEEIDNDLVEKFKNYINLHSLTNLNSYAQFEERTQIGYFNFKFTFFCPLLPSWNGNGFKYVNGVQMIDFIWECLNDKKKIDTCSRRYNLNNWNELEVYIKFFKESETKANLDDFINHFSKSSR